MTDDPNDPDDSINISSFVGDKPKPDSLATEEARALGKEFAERNGIVDFSTEYFDRYDYLKKKRIRQWNMLSLVFGGAAFLVLLLYPYVHRMLFPENYFSVNDSFWIYFSGKITAFGFFIALLAWALRNLGRLRRLLAVYKDKEIIAKTYEKILQSGDPELIKTASSYALSEIFSCAPMRATEKDGDGKSAVSLDDVIKLVSAYSKHGQ